MDLFNTDEEIVNHYRDGNKDLFKILIDRYISPIYNFTARLTDKEIANDIVQEVFIKVWKKIDHFDSQKSSFKTWIFTIARNTTIDFLRKKKLINFTSLENDTDSLSFASSIKDETLLPDEILQKLQDSELLSEKIESLLPQHKTVLILHYQEELTFSEIGKILNKPLNTVKSYHHRAIIKLREML